MLDSEVGPLRAEGVAVADVWHELTDLRCPDRRLGWTRRLRGSVGWLAGHFVHAPKVAPDSGPCVAQRWDAWTRGGSLSASMRYSTSSADCTTEAAPQSTFDEME